MLTFKDDITPWVLKMRHDRGEEVFDEVAYFGTPNRPCLVYEIISLDKRIKNAKAVIKTLKNMKRLSFSQHVAFFLLLLAPAVLRLYQHVLLVSIEDDEVDKAVLIMLRGSKDLDKEVVVSDDND